MQLHFKWQKQGLYLGCPDVSLYSAYQGAWLCLLIVYEGNECCYPTMAWVAEKGWRWLVRPGKLARGGEYYKASGFHRQD